MTDIARLDATAQAALVRSGEVSPRELVDAALKRIDRLNPELNAVIHRLDESARATADALGRGEGPGADGPFRGVPLLLKDLGAHSAGDPLCEGMGFLRDAGYRADADTHLATKFRQAGFVFAGKTNTPEMGILPTTEPTAFGPSRNPWNTGHSTGGSSGGSAAAVAAGIVPVAHANDGGGSIRIPASECGLVGLKPSRARVSVGPDYGDVMGGLTCELVVSRSVRDTAAILDAVAGAMPGDPYAALPAVGPWLDAVGRDPGSLRIGILTTVPGAGTPVHPDCVAAAEDAGRLLESLGHHVEVSHPAALGDPEFTTHFITQWAAGNAWTVDYWADKVGRPVTEADVEPLTWALCELGRSFTAPQWLTAREYLQRVSRGIASWWSDEGFDLLLTPTIAEPPPPLGSFDSPADNPLHGLFRAAAVVPFTPPFNVTGQPGISVPLWWNDAGLPIGTQLVAADGREDLLLAVAAQLEAARPWADRWPPLSA